MALKIGALSCGLQVQRVEIWKCLCDGGAQSPPRGMGSLQRAGPALLTPADFKSGEICLSQGSRTR